MEASVASPNTQVFNVAVPMTEAENQMLQEQVRLRGISESQVLREALAEKSFFSQQRRNGNTIVVKYPNGKLSNVTFSYE